MKILGLFLVLVTANAQFPRLNRTTALKVFKPLLPIGSVEERDAPFDLPPGYTYTKIADRLEWNKTNPGSMALGGMIHFGFAGPEYSVPGAGAAYPNADKFIFVPLNSARGALLRYNVVDHSFVVLAQSNAPHYNQVLSTFNVSNDAFQNTVSVAFTPFNTLLWGEQHYAGRLFEVQNPFASKAEDANIRWLPKIPSTFHDGMRFDRNNWLYFVDNLHGMIFRYIPADPAVTGMLLGQTFALKFDHFNNTGPATWVAMTDRIGNKLTVRDPFDFRGFVAAGVHAAEELGVGYHPLGTWMSYTNLCITVDGKGRDVMYMAGYRLNRVDSIILNPNNTTHAQVFADRNTIDIATGLPIGDVFGSPYDIACGPTSGTVYFNLGLGRNFWQASDANSDGVAESMGLWISTGTQNQGLLGLFVNPNNPNDAIIGQGGISIWRITYNATNDPAKAPVVPPKAFTRTPTKAPVVPMNPAPKAPVVPGNPAPKAPTKAPVVPTRVPARAPTRTPVKAPTRAPIVPTKPPVACPIPHQCRRSCHVYADPHFSTWQGTCYSYHGGGDFVLVQNALLQVQIRTQSLGGWSGVTQAAVVVGGTILRIDNKRDIYINNINVTAKPPATVAGYSLDFVTLQTYSFWRLTLNGGQFVDVIPAPYNTLNVHVSAHGSDFGDSLGMCGSWSAPQGFDLVGRDGKTTFSFPFQVGAFGGDWQVRLGTGNRFLQGTNVFPPSNSTEIQFIEGVCSAGPTSSSVCIERAAAAKTACQAITTDLQTRANCEFDILMSGETLPTLQNPAYVNPVVGRPAEVCAAGSGGTACQSLGGQCAFRCDPLLNTCRSDLCQVVNVTGCSCAIPLSGPAPRAPTPRGPVVPPSVPVVGPTPTAAPRGPPISTVPPPAPVRPPIPTSSPPVPVVPTVPPPVPKAVPPPVPTVAPRAPTKAPLSPPVRPTPSKCGLLGLRIFCPVTRCGMLGRAFNLCRDAPKK